MKRTSLLREMKVDLYRYTGTFRPGPMLMLSTLYHHISLIHIMLYRVIKTLQRVGVVGKVLAIPLKLLLRIIGYLVGIHLDLRSELGEGFYIGHFGGIFIGPIQTGRCCNVNQGVTLGQGGRGTINFGVPTLGDYVWIGPGAVIYGGVRIGSNVCVGANTVISKDIPDNAIVVGNPGRIIGYQKSDDHVYLDNICPPKQPESVNCEPIVVPGKL